MSEAHLLAPSVPRSLGRLRVALDDAYLRTSRQFGLTPQQAELLCAAMRPAPTSEIARVLRCDQSNVTRLVDRASRHGFVRRRAYESDGRVAVIELSPKGRRLAERFIAALELQLDDLLTQWPTSRRHAAARLLDEISDALDALRPQAQSRAPTA